jgi:hypothetical protein
LLRGGALLGFLCSEAAATLACAARSYNQRNPMGLALVTVTPADFDHIRNHLVTHSPDHQNMHLRQHCQRGGVRDLRFLHAMHLKPGDPTVIQGMISGPDVLWEYELLRRRTPTQVNVVTDEAPEAERDRIERHFLTQIRRRIEIEQRGFKFRPRFTPGQLYLRRKHGGMSLSNPLCRSAIAAGVLDEDFLATVLPWGFELHSPR